MLLGPQQENLLNGKRVPALIVPTSHWEDTLPKRAGHVESAPIPPKRLTVEGNLIRARVATRQEQAFRHREATRRPGHGLVWIHSIEGDSHPEEETYSPRAKCTYLSCTSLSVMLIT